MNLSSLQTTRINRVITISDLQKTACANLNPHLFEKTNKKKLKYRNKPTEVDGIKFDSKKESKRYGELKIRLKLGEIGHLELQKEFILITKSETENKCSYLADFVYRELKSGELIVEDVKSDHTRKLPVYIIKRKLMLSVHNIEIKEV